MEAFDLVEEHLIIRETVGYEFFNRLAIEDVPPVLDFLKIVNNYQKLNRLYEAKTTCKN